MKTKLTFLLGVVVLAGCSLVQPKVTDMERDVVEAAERTKQEVSHDYRTVTVAKYERDKERWAAIGLDEKISPESKVLLAALEIMADALPDNSFLGNVRFSDAAGALFQHKTAVAQVGGNVATVGIWGTVSYMSVREITKTYSNMSADHSATAQAGFEASGDTTYQVGDVNGSSNTIGLDRTTQSVQRDVAGSATTDMSVDNPQLGDKSQNNDNGANNNPYQPDTTYGRNSPTDQSGDNAVVKDDEQIAPVLSGGN